MRSKQPIDAITFKYAAIKFVSGFETRAIMDKAVKAEAKFRSWPEFA